jgi:hypothetical protein
MKITRGVHKMGEGCRAAAPTPQTPQNRYLKNTHFVDIISQVFHKFYVIYPSAEISHWNRLMTSTLEFWKIS